MTEHVDAAAFREAVALKQCPYPHDLGALAMVAAGVDELPYGAYSQLARSQQPNLYAHFSLAVDACLDRTLAAKETRGPFGLLAKNSDRYQRVKPKDITGWEALEQFWADTLTYDLTYAILDLTPVQAETMDLLWQIRNTGSGLQRTAAEQLAAGCHTAANACFVHAYGIDKFLGTKRVDKAARRQIVPRSHGPVRATAGLTIEQLEAFSQTYLGTTSDEGPPPKGEKNVILTDKDEIQFKRLYALVGSRVGLATRIEDLPDNSGQRIGDIKPALNAVRIGCPILFRPGQVQRLWGAFARTAIETGLL